MFLLKNSVVCGIFISDDYVMEGKVMEKYDDEFDISIAHIVDEETEDANLYMNTQEEDFIELEDDFEEDDLVKPVRKKTKQSKNKKIIMLVCILMVVIVCVTITMGLLAIIKKNTQNSYEYNYEKAKECYNDKKYEEAVKYFGIAMESNTSVDKKTKIDINMYLYDCYTALGMTNYKIDVLNQVLMLDENNEEAVRALSKIYYNEGNGAQLNELMTKYKSSGLYAVLKQYEISAPKASYSSGTYEDNIVVEITCDTSDATLYYTIDGSEPTVYATEYTEKLELKGGITELKVIAISNVGVKSEVATYNYEITYGQPPKPVLSAASGTYNEATLIELVNLPVGATAYYTWDGKKPTKSSAAYNADKKIEMKEGNNILSVIIVSKHGLASQVSTYVYNLVPNGKYSYTDAFDALKTKLVEKKVLKNATTLESGEVCRFVYFANLKIDGKNVYVVNFDIMSENGYERQSYQYGINGDTLDLYKVTKNGTKYVLSSL